MRMPYARPILSAETERMTQWLVPPPVMGLALYIAYRHISLMEAKPMREQSYLVLLALAPEPLYGHGIITTVEHLSDGRVKLGPGTLYGALDRLAGDGLITRDREEIVRGRLRRYYRLTGAGHEVLEAETSRLTALTTRARRRLAGPRISGSPA
jgi:DNA-binding PadR family transcriptional regulator